MIAERRVVAGSGRLTALACFAVFTLGCTPPTPCRYAAKPSCSSASTSRSCEAIVSDCTLSGKCTLMGNNWIAANDNDCTKFSYACHGSGLCRAVGGDCVAASEEDCTQSDLCADIGACHLSSGRCEFGGKADDDCRNARGRQHIEPCSRTGRCHVIDGACVATDKADCVRSSGCRIGGNCSVQSGHCVALTKEDCASSELCREGPYCVPFRGECTTGD